MKLRKFTEEGHGKYILLYDTIKESINKNNKDIEKGFSKKLQEEIKNLNTINKGNNEKDVFLSKIDIIKKKLKDEDSKELSTLKKLDIIVEKIKNLNEKIDQKKIVLQNKLI